MSVSPQDVEDGTKGGPKPSAVELFAVVWTALSEILGTSATATLLRRSAQRAAARSRGLGALSIVRDGLEYRYQVPGSWTVASDEGHGELRELLRDLWPLLIELTGQVIVGRLSQLPELTGLIPAEGPQ